MLSPLMKDLPFCFGLHPWYINEFTYQTFKNAFDHLVTNNYFFAIGEIGLDKICSSPFELQIEIFEKQLILAKNLNIPRIIIHSVKAHSEILQLLKKHKVTQKILIHDFYSTIETANQYLRFDTYFSFGAKLFTNLQAQEVLKQIPMDRIFLETDDQTKYNIFEIYDQAAAVLKQDKTTIISQISTNFSVFGQ